MASKKKKESEGIALLSMYIDDEEMEDAEQHHHHHHQQDQEQEDYEKQGNLENHLHQNLQSEERSEEEEGEVVRGISVWKEDEIREQIRKFIILKQGGRSYNAEVRNKKDYGNPDFLLYAVRYQDIDQIDSCFRKDVFDPHGYDPSDYYDEIELDMKREAERKEQEWKRSQRIDFVSRGTRAGVTAPIPKANMPIAGVATATAINLRSVDAVPRDGRQNKKSKWDKVDGGGQESILAVAAHAAILSAAGAGYTAFAQQRRREAEEKRSSEKKLERRS